MSRSDRLFRLMHLLRTLPPPVRAARLAAETEVSDRTVYRDIDTLRGAGARIEGEAGYGYTLTEDPALPPQDFDRMEVEALLVGLAGIRQSGDAELAQAGDSALAKLVARLPEARQRQALHAIHFVHRDAPAPVATAHVSALRQACWDEAEVVLDYLDAEGRATERPVWPLTIAYLDHALMLLAWCRLREDFRTFRIDRVGAARPTGQSFRPRRVPMLRDYVARREGEWAARRRAAGEG